MYLDNNKFVQIPDLKAVASTMLTLQMISNLITDVPNRLLDPLTAQSLVNLVLSKNPLVQLPNVTSAGLRATNCKFDYMLQLQGNDLSNLTHCYRLYYTGNTRQHIPEFPFVPVTSNIYLISFIRNSWNDSEMFMNANWDGFASYANDIALYMGSNEFTEFPFIPYASRKAFRALYLDANSIHSIARDRLEGWLILQSLGLDNNKLVSIPPYLGVIFAHTAPGEVCAFIFNTISYTLILVSLKTLCLYHYWCPSNCKML